jgi:hypothetical protein
VQQQGGSSRSRQQQQGQHGQLSQAELKARLLARLNEQGPK